MISTLSNTSWSHYEYTSHVVWQVGHVGPRQPDAGKWGRENAGLLSIFNVTKLGKHPNTVCKNYLHNHAANIGVVDGDVKENFWVGHDFVGFWCGVETRWED